MPLEKGERELIAAGLKTLGILRSGAGGLSDKKLDEFHDEKVDSFSLFLEELLLWNRRTNLIGKATTREIIIRHVFDSLSVYHLLKEKNASILDVGAGAGFPSVPLAIIDRALRIAAVERRHKRAAFLQNIAVLLNLDHLEVIEADVRDISGRFDVVLARGVGELAVLYELTRKTVKEHAMIIAFKGRITEIEKEVSRLKEKTAGGKSLNLSIQRVRVPFLDEEERNIVIIETK
ncbi:MAG: hypothetical protein AMS17_05805 [Spirochaetes bacterium DG_61]|nr:MAG: hypothetical protein AMS17_05805 [Spirochaetes bacterium DG_61]